MPGGNPSSHRRKLKARLQKARGAAGLTQREAARRLDWSESKLIRVENGEVSLSVTDLQAMLQLYGVTDQQAIADLAEAARGSRGSSWWSGYRDVVSPKFALYLGQEASAASIRVFHPFLIPGLLHTEDYAFELLRVHCSDEDARRIVEMRRQRQMNLLGHADSPEVTFILGEEALHRWIGSPALMQRQLQYLLEASEQAAISIQVIPFNAGAHPGLLGSFILLDFEDPAEHLLFVEGLSGNLVSRSDQEKIDRFTGYFNAMCKQALSANQTKALIKQLIEVFRQEADNSSGEGAQAAAEGLGVTTGTASKVADAREVRWRSSNGGVRSLPSRHPQGRIQSLTSSHGPSATGGAPSASSRLSAAYFSSLSSALL